MDDLYRVPDAVFPLWFGYKSESIKTKRLQRVEDNAVVASEKP